MRWIRASCRRCGFPLPGFDDGGLSGLSGEVASCPHCVGRRLGFDRAYAAALYADGFRQVLLAHKFRGDLAARGLLVSALEWACRQHGFYFAGHRGFRVITSVPQHIVKHVLRGRDPARELAQSFAARKGQVYRRLLRKKRWTRAQVTLSRDERRRNPRHSFAVASRRPLPERIVLVDDVLTTATTASECAKVLKAAGAKEVVVLALARS